MRLLERDAQLDALHAALERARRGGGSIVLVSGEAGIGKAGADPDLAELLSGPAPAPARVGEDALAGQLERARAVLQSRPDELTDRPSGLPPELEALREFHLPPGCLR